jgi:hypothetical protein
MRPLPYLSKYEQSAGHAYIKAISVQKYHGNNDYRSSELFAGLAISVRKYYGSNDYRSNELRAGYASIN